jgi:hypothetical protein
MINVKEEPFETMSKEVFELEWRVMTRRVYNGITFMIAHKLGAKQYIVIGYYLDSDFITVCTINIFKDGECYILEEYNTEEFTHNYKDLIDKKAVVFRFSSYDKPLTWEEILLDCMSEDELKTIQAA